MINGLALQDVQLVGDVNPLPVKVTSSPPLTVPNLGEISSITGV
jgi:hypothetical protein